MKIEPKEILIKDLVKNYEDSGDNGVVGYDGKLDIRPPYQREFVYKDKQRDAVIDSIMKEFPLNSIYWIKNGNRFEVLDGQQRIISICQYVVANEFAYKSKYFSNLTNDVKDKILNYKLNVYICDGNDSEKLEWFKIINIAGEKLTDQELRNAVYTGSWLSSAKTIFSKSNCAAKGKGEKYLNGSPIRQEYLETALKWVNDDKIEQYMAKHQQDSDANELWQYFQKVINWVELNFINYRREMKGLEWGFLYNAYKDKTYNSNDLEKKVAELMEDDEVDNKKGIYEYLLGGNPKHLNLRTFSIKQKREHFEANKQAGTGNKAGADVCTCAKCNEKLELHECEADHIVAWSLGGKTTMDNLQLLCKKCNGEKSNN